MNEVYITLPKCKQITGILERAKKTGYLHVLDISHATSREHR